MPGDRWGRLIPDLGDASDPLVRSRYGALEGWVSILGNLGLFALKLVVGLFISSLAVIADAFHSLSDVATSGVVILGFRFAKKPPDSHHPHGHGRVEHIATLVIAVLLAITGFELVLKSVEKLRDPSPLANEEYAVLVAVIVLASAGAKELLARWASAMGRRIGSDVLEADAWHHRSDAISSIGVALSVVGTSYGIEVLDPVFGVFVAVIIIYVGAKLVRSSASSLIGEAPDRGLVEDVRALAARVDGVEGVHDITVHDYGSRKVIALHVEVATGLTVDEAHSIADALDSRLKEVTSTSTIIHIDPKGMQSSGEAWREELEAFIEGERSVVSHHQVRVFRGKARDELTMHLIVDKDMSVEDSHELCHRLEAWMNERYGNCNVTVHFEPCKGNCPTCKMTCDERSDVTTG